MSAKDRTRLLALSGLTFGLLPLLQAHSFFGVGIITVVVALMEVSDIPHLSTAVTLLEGDPLWWCLSTPIDGFTVLLLLSPIPSVSDW